MRQFVSSPISNVSYRYPLHFGLGMSIRLLCDTTTGAENINGAQISQYCLSRVCGKLSICGRLFLFLSICQIANLSIHQWSCFQTVIYHTSHEKLSIKLSTDRHVHAKSEPIYEQYLFETREYSIIKLQRIQHQAVHNPKNGSCFSEGGPHVSYFAASNLDSNAYSVVTAKYVT